MPLESGSEVEDRLADLRALTDSALGQLDIEELLTELLRRVVEILDADTAAVLLLDETSRDLVATAACGIEEEVRQGVRVPLGVGFAGRIAATSGAIRLDHVDSTTVSNPLLWERGIRVMLGVPLLAGDGVVGVLHVGRLDDRAFTAGDAELLQVVAERVAGATQGRQLAVERAAAEVLERSLLPGRLPVRHGIEFAARYIPAAGRLVGGDWYDAFELPSGDLWVVIGDVAGHSLQAAVVMGRVRSALRAFTLLGAPPEEVLRLLDRKIDAFELDAMVTLACGVTRSPFTSLQLAVAGHPPPIVAMPDQPAVIADTDAGPVLGLGVDVARSSSTMQLSPGMTIVFYTDGLIERRGESLDLGLERLRAVVSSTTPRQVAHTVMRELIGNADPQDDVALLVVHMTAA